MSERIVPPYSAEPDAALMHALRLGGRLADMRPFVEALAPNRARVSALVGMKPGSRRRWRCPCCRPSIAYVTIERKTAGAWRITHPLPYCPEFNRFDQAD